MNKKIDWRAENIIDPLSLSPNMHSSFPENVCPPVNTHKLAGSAISLFTF